MYFFLFIIVSLFSSNPLQIKWKGLDIDLSQCEEIKTIYNDLNHGLNDQTNEIIEKIFREFSLTSKEPKKKEYVKNLFNEAFDPTDATLVPAMKLVNLLMDRKDLGLPKSYCDPLLKECIKRGFCNDRAPLGCMRPLTFQQSILLKNSRTFYFEYLKNHMTADPELLPHFFLSIFDQETRSIRSSPEWYDLMESSNNANCFFDTLIKFIHQNTLYLDNINPKLLTLLFQKIGKSSGGYPHIEISNSIINETLFDLKVIIKGRRLSFKNCHHLKVGITDKEIHTIAYFDFLHLLRGYDSGTFSFRDCSLDSESLEKCKDFIHAVSMSSIIYPLHLSLNLAFLLFCDFMILDEFPLFFSIIVRVIYLAIAWRSAIKFPDFSYWGILVAMQIAHTLVPIVLKDQHVFIYRGLSYVGMGLFFIIAFVYHYRFSQGKMRQLMKNPFGIITKYAFLDRLCKIIF